MEDRRKTQGGDETKEEMKEAKERCQEIETKRKYIIKKNSKKTDRRRQSGAEREERTRLGCCAKLHLTL